MAKLKTVYLCQECGHESPKWIGKCPQCLNWNTYVEEVTEKKKSQSKPSRTGRQPEPVLIQDVEMAEQPRIKAPGKELNRVLGGGIVPGSMVLIGGEPGIGKSTLLLQTAVRMKQNVLYVSGEESERQLKMRADRIGVDNQTCYILASTDLNRIFKEAKKLKPDLIIIDSIQTIHTQWLDAAAGTVSQIRECAGELLRFAKESNTPVFLVGHITKEGQIAGPKLLEHMVDAVLQFEGDRHHTYRILRTVKNRFGSTSELGIYEMKVDGMREVNNPSELLVSRRDQEFSGIANCASVEGMRPFIIEAQALVSSAVYGTPQRNTTGYHIKRLNTILAVLEKRCGFPLGAQDVFVNIAGGLTVDDPAMDLGIAVSILSSMENKAIQSGFVFCGEVGLSGEVRAVARVEQRIKEAEKLGFSNVILSAYNPLEELTKNTQPDIQLIPINRIDEVYNLLF
jgi:DNA repair protein RadA/Sms